MSSSLLPVWGDDSLTFQWGDFSPEEQERLRILHDAWNIVLAIPDERFSLAPLALQWFTRHFAALQDNRFINPEVRIIACFVDDGDSDGCNAIAFSLAGRSHLDCEQPTYAIHVNIHAVPQFVEQTQLVISVFERQLKKVIELPAVECKGSRCGLVAVMFAFFHELAHIARGHLEWNPPVNVPFHKLSSDAQRVRKALELDADFISATLCQGFIRHLYESEGYQEAPADQFTRGCMSIIAMYSAVSTLNEGGVLDTETPSYFSAAARLLVIVQRLSEMAEISAEEAMPLVLLLAEGLEAEAQHNRAVSKKLNFVPGRHEAEFREIAAVTAPELLALQNQGRLRGWLVDNSGVRL